MACFENGADLHGEWLAAVVALVNAYPGGLALHLRAVADHAALRAGRAMGPDAGFHVRIGGFFVVEVWGGKTGIGHGRLSAKHRV